MVVSPMSNVKPGFMVKVHMLYYRFLRSLGVVPRKEFMTCMDDILNVLKAFETFSLNVDTFCIIVSKRLGIEFHDGKPVMVHGSSKSDDDVEEEYRSRGMI
jgi:hypothetical protein